MVDLELFCLVDGKPTSRVFSVKVASDDVVGDLKDRIKAVNAVKFKDVDANDLTLWQVSIPVPEDGELPIVLDALNEKKKLKPTDDLSDVFVEKQPKKTIHIIVQRPQPVHAPAPIRAPTLFPAAYKEESRPGTLLSRVLSADLKEITDKFFESGSPVTDFLASYVSGKGRCRLLQGLFEVYPEHGVARSLASAYILDMVKENNRPFIPVFGVSGCGKTRAVIELLSQHWGFYFNASSDDWGSSDMSTLQSDVENYLVETRTSNTVDRQANNAIAKKMTYLVILSRLLILKYCLNVPGSSETFTSARWTLLQVCPHILFEDIFNLLFKDVRKLRHYDIGDLMDLVREVFEETRAHLVQHVGMPKFEKGTKLLVVHDEAQILGELFEGSFESMPPDESPRPLLSPVLHAFRDIGEHQLTLVTCGAGLSINTLYWVQCAGSSLKDTSSTFKYMEFAGWADQESITDYISRIRSFLVDDDSRRPLDKRLPQGSIGMMLEKLRGRFRPIVVAIEKIIEGNGQGAWQVAIKDTEDKLVSWSNRDAKGNLCYELRRLHEKCNKNSEQLQDFVEGILGLLLYRHCMFGDEKLELDQAVPELVERAFGRIKVVGRHVMTVLDEPFVMKAVENYFSAKDPYFRKEIQRRIQLSDSVSDHGNPWEYMMMSVFSETFKERPLSGWPHEPPISEMCAALVGDMEIVGWKETGLEQGTSFKHMLMEEFMDAHINHKSMRNNKAVAPFFFPKPQLSGPDMVFYIQVKGRLFPVFVRLKLRQDFSAKEWKDALSTVSAEKIESHAKEFLKYCPEKTYISMIVAYPAKWTSKLQSRPDIKFESDGIRQVVINIGDRNFGKIFPKKHVEFIVRLKNSRKRPIENYHGEDRSKKLKY
ncbi:hypothetical protein BGZ51_007276 [Haplosporangium sp. Z 767]|nr:hypothetical protein BGZ51_007276 [Haplosporangium sp. Z 767]